MTSIDTVVGTTMKVTCGRDELADKLQLAGRGVSTRTQSVQILGGIMLRAAEGRLHLSATDMEISLRVALDAQVEDEGAVVVPGRLLVDIVRLLPAGEVTIGHRAEEGVAELTCGSASYKLHTYAAEDFPRLTTSAIERTRMSRSRDRIMENLETMYREAFERAKATGDEHQMATLDFAYRREQLYLEILLDIREATERR